MRCFSFLDPWCPFNPFVFIGIHLFEHLKSYEQINIFRIIRTIFLCHTFTTWSECYWCLFPRLKNKITSQEHLHTYRKPQIKKWIRTYFGFWYFASNTPLLSWPKVVTKLRGLILGIYSKSLWEEIIVIASNHMNTESIHFEKKPWTLNMKGYTSPCFVLVRILPLKSQEKGERLSKPRFDVEVCVSVIEGKSISTTLNPESFLHMSEMCHHK